MSACACLRVRVRPHARTRFYSALACCPLPSPSSLPLSYVTAAPSSTVTHGSGPSGRRGRSLGSFSSQGAPSALPEHFPFMTPGERKLSARADPVTDRRVASLLFSRRSFPLFSSLHSSLHRISMRSIYGYPYNLFSIRVGGMCILEKRLLCFIVYPTSM